MSDKIESHAVLTIEDYNELIKYKTAHTIYIQENIMSSNTVYTDSEAVNTLSRKLKKNLKLNKELLERLKTKKELVPVIKFKRFNCFGFTILKTSILNKLQKNS